MSFWRKSVKNACKLLSKVCTLHGIVFSVLTYILVMSETTGSSHKLISCFHSQSKSKNVAARELTARYIEQTLMIISPQRALADTRDLTEKIILSMISALNDSAHETRQYGKRIVVLLAKYEHFEAICGKYLSTEDNRKGMFPNDLKQVGLRA